MGRRIKDFTFTVSYSNGSLQQPYMAYTIEVDLDGEKAQIEHSGARPWESLPQPLRAGLQALIQEITGERKTGTLNLGVKEIEEPEEEVESTTSEIS